MRGCHRRASVLCVCRAAPNFSKMPDSVGKQLSKARLQRGLSLDEVAHATKLRPEKILALENDDLSSFPSNAYAKGHLKNYARYLDVDVAAFLTTIDSTLPISVAEYQYLTNAPERLPDLEPMRRDRRPPSILPLLTAAAVVFLVLAGFWLYANAQRIFAEPAPRTAAAPALPATPAPVLTTVAPDIALPATLSLEPAPPPAAEPTEMKPAPIDDGSLLKPTASADPVERDFVTPRPVATAEPTPAVAQPGENEVLIASLKKTWITVRRDDPKAPPIFEDFLYPDTRPLKVRGVRFFIEARDPASVQITKNGLPIAYQPPGVPIQ